MRTPLWAALITLGTGCWYDYEPSGLDELPFRNEHVRTQGGRVATFEVALDCPDGEPARFYLVFDDSWTAAAPVAVVMHSGAFDYTVSPQSADSPLEGPHYAASFDDYTRLERPWAVLKVWETMGMYQQVDPTEFNSGSLAARLLDDGIATLYPANCWGDLWHNDTTQPNKQGEEFIQRYGLTFAQWMVQIAEDAAFRADQGVELPIPLDPSELYLVGLGAGARGVFELLAKPDLPPVAGALVDSPVDDLAPWATLSQFADEATGLERIYNYDGSNPKQVPNWTDESLATLVTAGAVDGVNLAVVYSDGDPQVPDPGTQLDPLLEALINRPQVSSLVVNTGVTGHVFSNDDVALSDQVVGFMKTGTAE